MADFLDSFNDAITKRINNDLSRIGMGNNQPTNQQVTNQPLVNPNQQPTADTAQYQYVAPQQPQMQNVAGMGGATGTGLTIPGAPQQAPIAPIAPTQTPGANQVLAQPQMQAQQQPVQTQPQPVQTQPQPVQQTVAQQAPQQSQINYQAPPQQYNQYIAQQESGNNPNIGYHNPQLSSSYGTYGITAPAYQDIQNADPYFQNRPITSLSPDEQTRANDVLRNVNSVQLRARGVEPTESNLRLAHLLGAKGARDYLTNGYLSPEAIAANGGEEKLRQIAENRMQSGQAPAMQKVGLATAPANQSYEDQLHNNQNDPEAMARLSYDKSAPEYIRKAAADQHLKQLQDVRAQQDAQKKIQDALQNGNTTDFARMLKTSGDEGSYVKAYLYHRFGLNDLAKNEQQKLGAGNKWQASIGPNGERAVINYDGNGLATQGYDEKGRQLSGNELAKYAASGIGINKPEYVGGSVVNDTTGQIGRIVSVGGKTMVESNGRYEAPTTAWRQNTVGANLELGYNMAVNKGYGGQVGKNIGQGYQQPAGPTSIPGAPVGNVPNAPTGPIAPTTPSVTGQPAPTGGQPAPQAQPQPNANPAIPNPNVTTPAAGGTPPVWQQKQQGEIAGKRSEAFNKIIDTEYRENGQKGEVVSNNRKQQFDILNRVDPTTGKGMAETISGLYNAANENPKEQKWAIVRDILSGGFKDKDEVSNRLAQLNISPAAKAALQEYNALNAQIASQTLRETAGPGSVSDAEQAANRARSVDITKAPMLGVYNMMSQSQFNGDLQRYKSDLASTTNAPNATAFDRDFRRTQAELIKTYRERTEERLAYIDAHGGATNPAAIHEAYKRYPVPEYNPDTGNWKYLKSLSEH